MDAAAALGVEFDLALTQPMVGRNFRDCQAIIATHYGDDFPTVELMRAWHVAYDAIVDMAGYEHINTIIACLQKALPI